VVVHNPHYFEYMRRTHGNVPRQPGDDGGCAVRRGGIPTANQFVTALRRHGSQPDMERLRRVQAEHQRLLHARYVLQPPVQRRWAAAGDNTDLRLRYLLREIDDAEWQKQLQQREKTRGCTGSALEVYNMVAQVGEDLLRNAMEDRATLDATANELRTVMEYANDQIEALCKQYKMKISKI
jgi:hypothetical protein